MLFNSTEFAVFMAIVLVAYYGLLGPARARARKIVLLVASYAFYMSWNPFFGSLIAFSTLLDYTVARRLPRAASVGRRRLLVLASVAGNLGLLGYFKYGAFFARGLTDLSLLSTESALRPWLDVALPVGISFYTFQTMSYTLEVYWGRYRPTHDLLDFALYVSFFPQLVAGPIVRPQGLLPQLESMPRAAPSDLEYGAMRIMTGLLKKVVFADSLGVVVDRCFDAPGSLGAGPLLLGVYAYAFQIYFDFAGYTDIAIGLARLFGIRLPENFDRPYLAESPREFWQRWHITLSTWLRDYLYVPLGGSRRGPTRTQVNLLITMALGGLWHGAGWNFVIWGVYHGVLLVGHRLLFRRPGASAPRLPAWLRRVVTFHLVCLGWVFFRAPTLDDALAYLAGFARGGGAWTAEMGLGLGLLVVAAGIHFATPRDAVRDRLVRAPALLQGAVYGAIAILLFLFSGSGQRFIYFQF